MWKSTTRHCGDCSFSDFRNSVADTNVVISKDEAASSRPSALRTDASSSTSATRVEAFPIRHGFLPAFAPSRVDQRTYVTAITSGNCNESIRRRGVHRERSRPRLKKLHNQCKAVF